MGQAKNKKEFIKHWTEHIDALERLRYSLPIQDDDEDVKFRIARERIGNTIDELKQNVVPVAANYSFPEEDEDKDKKLSDKRRREIIKDIIIKYETASDRESRSPMRNFYDKLEEYKLERHALIIPDNLIELTDEQLISLEIISRQFIITSIEDYNIEEASYNKEFKEYLP